jgi:hypothetical protein
MIRALLPRSVPDGKCDFMGAAIGFYLVWQRIESDR